MYNEKHFSSAQRSYDNMMPDDDDTPEMDCPNCGESVSLEDTGLGYNTKFTGTCEKCDTYCEYSEVEF